MGEALEVGEERMATAILFIVDVDNAIEEAAIGALPPIRLRNTQRLPKLSKFEHAGIFPRVVLSRGD